VTTGKATVSKRRIAWGRYLLLFFVAAWMFFLGVLVGRGTAPVHFDTRALQKELSGLRDAMMKKEREAVARAIRGEDRKAPLAFYEELKKDGMDTGVQIPAPQASTGGPPAPSEAAGVVKTPHKSRTAIMAKRAVTPVGSASGSVASTTPAPNPATGDMTIQVASLKDGTAAGRIVAALKREGYPAYLSRIVIPGKGLWFRVRVGSYKGRKQAATDMDRLTRAQKKPILVKK